MKMLKAVLISVISMSAYSTFANIQCKEDGTTMQMRACFVDELKIEEVKLNKALEQAIKSSHWAAKEINHSQDVWIKYRDAHCEAVHKLADSGSIGFISEPLCLLDLTKQRTSEILQSFKRDNDF